jgi:hypothetical protein
MTPLKTWIPISVVVVSTAILAGCGGGGSSSADFVADGNQICKEDNAKFKQVAPPESDVRPYLDELVPLLDEDLARLKGLTPPSDKASTYDAWISDLEEATALAKQAQEAPSSDAATQILQKTVPIGEQSNAEARELGLDQCATSAGSGSSSG